MHGAAVGLRRSSDNQLIQKSWGFETDCQHVHSVLAAYWNYTGEEPVLEVIRWSESADASGALCTANYPFFLGALLAAAVASPRRA